MLIGTINSGLALVRAFATKTLQKLLILTFAVSLTTLGLPVDVFAAVPTAPDITFKLLAAGERASVLAPTVGNSTTNHNGSEWYYNTTSSIGFANGGSTVSLGSADTSYLEDTLRLSWHAWDGASLNSGWRLGDVYNLDGSTNYRRYIYEANTLPTYYPSGPQTDVSASSLAGWTLCYSDYYASTASLSDIWASCDGNYLLYAGALNNENKIEVKEGVTSVLDFVGGGQAWSASVSVGDTLSLSLYESDSTTAITWSDFRVYVSNCAPKDCSGFNPFYSLSNWDSGTVVNDGTYTVPASADGKYLAIFSADDATGAAVNANWIKLEVERTPLVYGISNCEQLEAIGTTGYPEDTYKLTNDIDCTGIDFDPIAWDFSVFGNDDFKGIFDGRNYTISNLTIDEADNSDVGLFNEAQDNAVFKNVVFKDSVIKGRSDTGTLVGEADDVSAYNIKVVNGLVEGNKYGDCGTDIGGIIGEIDDDLGPGSIERLYFNGVISAEDCDDVGGIIGDSDDITISRSGTDAIITADYQTGGLIGRAYDTEIVESYSAGTVTGDNFTGGLVGRQTSGETLRSYSNASVEGSTSVGGLIGSGGNIFDSYATGGVKGSSNVGGLLGECNGNITNSYSTGLVTGVDSSSTGGLVGFNSGACSNINSFWDSETSGTTDSNAGTAKTTAEMKDEITFIDSGWEFVDLTWLPYKWMIDPVYNNGYPCHVWDSRTCMSDGDKVTAEVENFAPNGGDANNDGIIDSQQAYVTGYVNSVVSKYVAIETNFDCNISEVGSTEESTTAKDSGYKYEQGLLNFEADCGTPGYTTTVKMFFYGVNKANLVARKFKPANNSYFNVPGATITETTIDNRVVTMVEYSIKDGGELDLDGAENGVIIDPVGLGKTDVGAPNTGLGGFYGLVKMIR